MLLLLASACAPAPAVIVLLEPGVLVHETFDGPGLPAGWTYEIGAATGDGPLSAFAVADGAVVVTVRPEDRRFQALTHAVAVGDARWLRVTARVRTEDVDPTRARFQNCDVFLRFDDGPVQGLPRVTGTTPWTDQARIVAVPEGASRLNVGLFLSMPGVAAFDDVRVTAVDPGWRVEEDGVYVYHLLPGDDVDRDARAFNRAKYAEELAFFGMATGPLVHFWKYPDRATKGLHTGDPGNAHASLRDSAIHSIWARDDHEIVHLLSMYWGQPPALLGEGMAVWRSGAWQGEPIRHYAGKLGSRWIPLSALASTPMFRAQDSLLTYAEAGAFVQWLAETRGEAELRRIYGTVGHQGGAAELEAALGMTLDEADAGLRAWLWQDE